MVMVISQRKRAFRRSILAIAEILFRDFWFHSFALFPLRCSSQPRRIQKSCLGCSSYCNARATDRDRVTTSRGTDV
jgi:hypothetical protein